MKKILFFTIQTAVVWAVTLMALHFWKNHTTNLLEYLPGLPNVTNHLPQTTP